MFERIMPKKCKIGPSFFLIRKIAPKFVRCYVKDCGFLSNPLNKDRYEEVVWDFFRVPFRDALHPGLFVMSKLFDFLFGFCSPSRTTAKFGFVPFPI